MNHIQSLQYKSIFEGILLLLPKPPNAAAPKKKNGSVTQLKIGMQANFQWLQGKDSCSNQVTHVVSKAGQHSHWKADSRDINVDQNRIIYMVEDHKIFRLLNPQIIFFTEFSFQNDWTKPKMRVKSVGTVKNYLQLAYEQAISLMKNLTKKQSLTSSMNL